MPVPTSMQDLATLASSNYPTGTEPIGNSLDNYIRAISAIIRSTNAVSSSTIAAASTVNLSGSDGEFVIITGSATINSYGTGFPGAFREVYFSAACTVVHSSAIPLPNASNIVVAAGDIHQYRCTTGGVWRLSSVNRMEVSSITGLQAALDLKVNLLGSQTIDGEITQRNGTLLGSAVSSLQNNGQYRFNTGNVDDIAFKAIRKSAGSGWPTASLRIQRVVDGVAAQGYIDFNGSSSGRVLSFGNSIPGTDLVWLDGSGNLTALGNIVSLSDEKMKEAWDDLPPDFLSKLSEVKHGVYRRKDTGQIQVGVSAQSLRGALPRAVQEDGDGVLAVAYGNAALVSAIQLAVRVRQLEARLESLEGQ